MLFSFVGTKRLKKVDRFNLSAFFKCNYLIVILLPDLNHSEELSLKSSIADLPVFDKIESTVSPLNTVYLLLFGNKIFWPFTNSKLPKSL